MFDKLQKLKQLKEMQSKMREEKVAVEENGVRVVMNAAFELEELTLNPELSSKDQEAAVRKALAQALKKIKTMLLKQFGAGGLGL